MKLIFIFLLIALFAFSKSIDLNDFRIISLPSFSPILIQKTEKFALKLKSNPSTGYQWYVKNENDLDKRYGIKKKLKLEKKKLICLFLFCFLLIFYPPLPLFFPPFLLVFFPLVYCSLSQMKQISENTKEMRKMDI